MTNAILRDEILKDEQLDAIAGGKSVQMADDSRFLNSLNGSCDRYGTTNIDLSLLFSSSKEKEIKNAWATVGITAKLYRAIDNEYFLNGQGISQEQARQHAMNVVGKQMTESDWQW